MKPILYLDNWDRRQPPNRFERLMAERGLDVVRIQANGLALPETVEYAGAFVGPSDAAAYDNTPWVRAEQIYLRRLASAGIPILGLCFGSQTLAWALFGDGSVFARNRREQGFGLISLTPEGMGDPLLRSLPPRAEVFHWHGDEVVADHPDLVLLATSDVCGNQIWRWRHGRVWGVQPHPEYDSAGFKAWFHADRERFERAGFPVDAVAPSACDGASQIFHNFIRILTEHTGLNQGE